MSVIIAKLNKNTSYIFHLLSVSQCGYDNVYGEINSKYHPIEDLKILKQYESYITVRGGKHSGELYGMLVCIPAALEDDKAFTEYINALIDLFGKDNLDSNYDLYEDIYKTAYASLNVTVSKASTMEFYNNFKKIKEPIVSICEVLKRNYQVFNNEIWPSTMENLELYVSKLNDIIGKSE
ncbi:MAG: hypothetical protein R6U15_03800, partial [Candidatus Izemoplasmatales bacterium]